jgi:hypothetical protein
MNVLVGMLLFFIVASLGKALFAMASGPQNSNAMLKALTWRIGLSVALFGLLMLGWYFGLIEPNGLRR